MYIIMHFRTDCCKDRMLGWLLRIGDIDSTYSNRVCAQVSEKLGVMLKIYMCEFGIRRGRYVYVVRKTNIVERLNIDELKVMVLNQDLLK